MQNVKAVFDAAVSEGPKPLPPNADPPPEQDTRNPHAVAMSKLGASEGGTTGAAVGGEGKGHREKGSSEAMG